MRFGAVCSFERENQLVEYGLGFAAGTYLGIAIEQRLAFGHQLASLFTRKGVELAQALRAAGCRLAEFQGHTLDGNLTILYVEIQRRQARKLMCDVRVIDATCFCVINDVRVSAFVLNRGDSPDPTVSRAPDLLTHRSTSDTPY